MFRGYKRIVIFAPRNCGESVNSTVGTSPFRRERRIDATEPAWRDGVMGHDTSATALRRARPRQTVAWRWPGVPGVLPVLRLARRGMAGVAPLGLAARAVVAAALPRLRASTERSALSGTR